MDADVIVIGAGFAGLSAARRLSSSSSSSSYSTTAARRCRRRFRVLVLEASDRVGGRARTESIRGVTLEHGAEFIHGGHAITRRLCSDLGIQTAGVVRRENLWWGAPGAAAVPPRDLPSREARMLEDVEAAAEGALLDPLVDGDVSLRDWCLEHATTLDSSGLEAADVLLAQTCCTDLGGLSVADMQLDCRNVCDEKDEARLVGGYAALVRALADPTVPTPRTLLDDDDDDDDDGAPTWSNHPSASSEEGGMTILTRVQIAHVLWHDDDGERRVTVEALDGRSFSSYAVVCAVPLRALQRRPHHSTSLRFSPPLPDDKLAAIESFVVHPATKVFVAFDVPQWPEGVTFLAHRGRLCRWFFPPRCPPDDDDDDDARGGGVSVAEAYVTADRARDVDALDGRDLADLALDELAILLGRDRSVLDDHHVWTHRVSWADDPYAGGGYASVVPGGGARDCRRALAEPTGGRIYWAGEATAYHSNPQTVHGAIESGLRAAREVERADTWRDKECTKERLTYID